MKEEDKKLLLIDLCARVPYGVKCMFDKVNIITLMPQDIVYIGTNYEIKPYLRPLYTMTKEEAKEFYEITGKVFKFYPGCEIYDYIPAFDNDCTPFDTFGDESEYERVKPENVIACIDFLNKHHFDYRGLIKRGLALEAPKDMYV